jgi:predicted GIY-YIG superfamily endonuclease
MEINNDLDNEIPPKTLQFSRHMLYILYNDTNNLTYNGYTVDFNHRLRQHNCELVGGARFTSKQVKNKNIIWKPLALIRVLNEEFDQRRCLSVEWSIKYVDNKRPRPVKYNNPLGRLRGLGLVFNNPKFADLIFHVEVFTAEHFEVLKSVCPEKITITQTI